MIYRWLAVAVVVLHLGYLAYLVVGGFVAWRWPRTFWLHAAAAVWAVLIIVTKAPCPLTWLQNGLRTRAGQPELESSFIDAYVRGVLFPGDHEIAARLAVGLVVTVSWVGLLAAAARQEPVRAAETTSRASSWIRARCSGSRKLSA